MTKWAGNLAEGAGSGAPRQPRQNFVHHVLACLSLAVPLKLSLCLLLISIIDGAIEALSKKINSAHFNRLKMLRSLSLKLQFLAMSLLGNN